jgi:hypothetical protein
VKRRSALGLAAVLAVGLAGCGIPDETEVRTAGGGPEPGFATSGAVGLEPPKRESATAETDFVDFYLSAAAGEPAKAYARVRDFIAPAIKDRLRDPGESVAINVVHVLDTDIVSAGVGGFKVTLKVEHVGVLNALGKVGPAVPKTVSYTFTIGTVEGATGLFITKDAPQVVLLSTEALSSYYEQRTLYYWSADGRVLVPDARYVPRAIAQELQPTEVLDMLIKGGPSPWLQEAVQTLPPGTDRTENVPDSADRLEVGLNAEAAQGNGAQVNVDQLGRQLLWSLRPYVRNELLLKIEGQANRPFAQDQAYIDANPASDQSETPDRFAIYQGKIYRLAGSPNAGVDPLPKLLLAAGVNQGIAAAGLAREETRQGALTAAALVVQKGQRFMLRVGSAYGNASGPFVNGAEYAQMGRPVWLKAPLDTGLVVADGQLYRFALGSAKLTKVTVEGISGQIDDVGVAPDGRRIAVAAGGKAYVAAITRENGGVEVVHGLQEVRAGLADVTGIDWSAETKVVVSGRNIKDGKIAVWQVSLDGAIVEEQQSEPSQITYLVAYPRNPLVTGSGSVGAIAMYARDGASYDLFGANRLVEASEVVGAPPDAPEGSAIAPFFLMN